MKTSFIDELLNDLCVNSKIQDGMFDICNKQHLEVLKEHLWRKGFGHDFIEEYLQRIDDGKFPERQAYNKEGYLVTFPNREYKDEALRAGTHFNRNPKGHETVWDDLVKTKELKKQEKQHHIDVEPGEPKIRLPEPKPKVEPKPAQVPDPVKPTPTPATGTQIRKPTTPTVKPVEKPAVEKPVEKPLEQPPTRPSERPDRPVEKPTVDTQPTTQDWTKSKFQTREYAKKLGWKENSAGDWFDYSGDFVAITTDAGYVKPVGGGNKNNFVDWPPLPEELNKIPPEIAAKLAAQQAAPKPPQVPPATPPAPVTQN